LVGIPFFLGEVPVSKPGNQAEDDQSEHGISSFARCLTQAFKLLI
jgi:hypothetical protein